MAYRGVQSIGDTELESVRRIKESGAVRLPDGSGFAVGTVGKKKKKESEGGPGSGPRPGQGGKGPKSYQSHDYKKQSAEFKRRHGDIATSPGQGQKTKPSARSTRSGGGRFNEKRVQLLSKEFKSLPRSDQRLLRPKIKEMVGMAFDQQEQNPRKASRLLDRAFSWVKRFKNLSGTRISLSDRESAEGGPGSGPQKGGEHEGTGKAFRKGVPLTGPEEHRYGGREKDDHEVADKIYDQRKFLKRMKKR